MPLTQVQAGMMDSTAQYYSFKNRIINGAMVIDQRNAGAAVTTSGSYGPDRFYFNNVTDGTLSFQQSTDVPSGQGFSYSARITATVGDASIGAAQYANLQTSIEGFNFADMGFGASGASNVTLSFWVKATVVGNYSVALYNSAENRVNPQQFSVSLSNTWEKKTITFAGDTTGTWLTTNGKGANVTFYYALGSNFLGSSGWNTGGIFGVTGQSNALSSNGNIFAITGVQLEKGSTATSFDYRPYGAELALCQRYFYKTYNQSVVPGTAAMYAGTGAYILAPDATTNNCHRYNSYPVSMRASPTITGYSPNNGNTSSPIWNSGTSTNIGWNPFNTNENGFGFHTTSSVNATSTCYVHWTASAEL